MSTLLIVLVVLLLIGAFAGAPSWGWHGYGWAPSGVIGLIVLVLVILLVMGRI